MPVITENPKHKRHEITDDRSINMTPMIDVVFQLILFFMLTSSLVRPNQIELQLPESTSGVKSKDEQALEVSYRVADGRPVVKLNQEEVADLEQLGAAMKLIAQRVRDEGVAQPRLDLWIDKEVPYQDVVAVMDTVRDSGFPKFSLPTMARGSGERRPLSAAVTGGDPSGDGDPAGAPGAGGGR